MTAAAPAPPPLDDGLEQLLRRMRLPHMRRIAPEVLAVAKAQRWDPAEVLRADLVVVDDIGLLPVGPDAAEGLYRLVDAAYERRSVAASSNLHPSGFDELMPKTLATATVDRLMHHAHIVLTAGDSIRLTQATRGKGVKPLAD